MNVLMPAKRKTHPHPHEIELLDEDFDDLKMWAAPKKRMTTKKKKRRAKKAARTATPGKGYRYYWAYGSNLHVQQMKSRCPAAVKVGAFPLQDGALVFRGVADVVGKRGSTVPGGLWLITPGCERALDNYEGVRCGLYRKVTFPVSLPNGEVHDCLFYIMNDGGIMPPSERYASIIEQGYRDFKLEQYLPLLEEAIAHSWDNKNKTPEMQRRYHRLNGNALARPVSLLAALEA